MRVIDAFCGTGGWSAGAAAAGCTPVLGVDCDHKPLRLWRTNCPSGRAACARLGTDDTVDWPDAAPDVHIHLSPPCTSLSKARAGSAPAGTVAAALETVRWCVRVALERGYTSWSLENVATPAVVACVAELARQHPAHVAYVVLDAADFGVASNRVRLIASTPVVVRALKEEPVERVSVADAFVAAGLALPAQFIKSNTSNRDKTPCVRSVQDPAFTVTASHPLIWCTRVGATVRCLTVFESAVLMGFPPDWWLPQGSRVGLRAVGNAVPPPLAKAVMALAKAHAEPLLEAPEVVQHQPDEPLEAPEAAQHEPAEPLEATPVPHEALETAPCALEPSEPSESSRSASPAPPEEGPLEPAPPKRARADDDALTKLRRKLRRLTRRVDALEGAVGGGSIGGCNSGHFLGS